MQLTVALSTSISVRLRLLENGTRFALRFFCQFCNNLLRNSWLKGPEYERNPVHINTSPASLKETRNMQGIKIMCLLSLSMELAKKIFRAMILQICLNSINHRMVYRHVDMCLDLKDVGTTQTTVSESYDDAFANYHRQIWWKLAVSSVPD